MQHVAKCLAAHSNKNSLLGALEKETLSRSVLPPHSSHSHFHGLHSPLICSLHCIYSIHNNCMDALLCNCHGCFTSFAPGPVILLAKKKVFLLLFFSQSYTIILLKHGFVIIISSDFHKNFKKSCLFPHASEDKNLCSNCRIFLPKISLKDHEPSCRRQKLQNFKQTCAKATYLEIKSRYYVYQETKTLSLTQSENHFFVASFDKILCNNKKIYLLKFSNYLGVSKHSQNILW